METQGGPESEPALRLRITHILSSMAPPLAGLRASYVPSSLPSAIPIGNVPHLLPVVRIFATTPSHQKVCANIHLAYPYFYVPFPMDSTNPLRPERVIGLCQRFAVSLNHAICLALRQNPNGPSNAANFAGGTDPKHLHVVSVILVKGIPFYGYHVGYSYFLKVSLANPARVRIATDQLRKPVVLGREWQPHEAHLSHVLQFMCDFDLYGCGTLDLAGGTFREPLPVVSSSAGSPETTPEGIINHLTAPNHMLYAPGLSPPRDTYSELEIDVLPHQIMNRNRLTERPLHHDFVELLHQPLDPEEKLVPAMKELWQDERNRRSASGLGTSELEMLPVSGGGRGRSMQELGYKADGELVDNRGGDWKISEEFWEMIEERMATERIKKGRLTFDRFSGDVRKGKNGEKEKFDRWVMTTYEAVSAHWPKQYRSQHRSQRLRKSQASASVRPSTQGIPSTSSPPPSSPIADEDEEDDPFNLAASQASLRAGIEAEVNATAVQVEPENEEAEADVDDEEEDGERQHEKAARLHAQEGERFRATQKAPEDEFDDDDLDLLFAQAVPGGDSDATPRETPRVTPGTTPGTTPSKNPPPPSSNMSAMSTGRRAQRRVEQAGFGDLSAIMEMSSFTMSSPSDNPYVDPHTPTRKRVASPAGTPSNTGTCTPSLVRNIFSRPRGSPLDTPTKSKPQSQATPGTNAIVLPHPLRAAKWSLSPVESVDSSPPEQTTPTQAAQPTPTPKQALLEIHARSTVERERVSNAQPEPPTPLPLPTKKRVRSPAPDTPTLVLSATLANTQQHQYHPTPAAAASTSAAPTPGPTPRPTPGPTAPATTPATAPSTNGRVRLKRVRLASPSSPVPLVASFPASRSSAASDPADPSNDSSNTQPTNGWTFVEPPPSLRDVVGTMEEYGLDTVEYHEPFYSDPADVPPRPKLFAGRAFRVKTNSVAGLPDFEHQVSPGETPNRWLKTRQIKSVRVQHGWEYALPPPSLHRVVAYCEQEDADAEAASAAASQLALPTQKNRYGFKLSQKKPQREQQNMSVLLLEVFAPSRHQLLPDPEKDEMAAVFFCFQNDREDLPDTTRFPGYHAGYVLVDAPPVAARRARLEGVPCHYVEGELDLINWVVDMVKDWDPDVLAGWELHNASWGYLAARAHHAFGTSLPQDLSRVITTPTGRDDSYSEHHTSNFKVTGRHVLNIWRIMRGEVTLTSYTLENIVFHVLHQRIPHYTAGNLTALWKSKTAEHTTRVLKTLFQRVVIYAELIDAAEIVLKNAEFARVFGVDFDAVMFRGSQFKVESFMFRIAKPESFVMVSPSKQQVGLQNAPFAVPLIAEPESKFYPHPIVVLDFQSLYPSVMIGYNICFSTCLGRVEKFKGTDKFGFTELKVAEGLLELLKDYLTVTPNGMIFVKPAVRKSLLAKMLGEILDTRVMVKNAMKQVRGDKALTSMLNARQLGLKLMANVTYGYTSATYSGRMPCIEIADSIVQTGRETLEKAQELIHSRADWNATVVYGDTDSLFISLPGRSKEQAFKIGHNMADTVTALNPKPVTLKFEKVYMGSLLMAKKRYVGFKYEHPDDTEPVFDAKGIETIRRDGFPAQQKIEEVCLKMLFRSQDLSQIKEFCRQEWTKILQGRVSVQDFIIAKEVRLGTYSEKGVPPPGAAVAYRRILKDPRDEPQYAERVPYIISNAEGRRLIDRARMPAEMLANPTLGIDAEYYIRNLLIPPLSRIFNLVGADVEAWYDSMPRSKRVGRYAGARGTRIDAHFRSMHCRLCGAEASSRTHGGTGILMCAECAAEPATTAHTLLVREHVAHARLADLHRVCAACAGTPVADSVLCSSVDCPVTYARTAAEKDATEVGDVRALIQSLDW